MPSLVAAELSSRHRSRGPSEAPLRSAPFFAKLEEPHGPCCSKRRTCRSGTPPPSPTADSNGVGGEDFVRRTSDF